MTTNPFVKATKEKAFLRLALVGVSGGGKTYSALNIAQHLVPGGKVAVIDTEHGSASKYADLFEFDTVELPDFKPASYVAMIKAAAANGYDVLIVDSLTHAWDALLALKDKEAAKKGQNSFTAWGAVNKHYDGLIDAIVGTPIHIIGTIRSKSDYIMEEYIVDGKTRTKPVKVGMKAIHRDGFEYEFDVVAQMDIDNRLIVEKTRCPALTGEVIEKPGAEIAETLRVWLSDGVEPAPNMHLYASIDGKEMFNETVHVDAHPPRQDTPRAQPKADRVETIGDVVLFSAKSWASINRRLVEAGLANESNHAFNRLKNIVAKELGDGNTITRAEEAKWTEADVIAKFETRKAEKANEG